jgi:hypothetical protein
MDAGPNQGSTPKRLQALEAPERPVPEQSLDGDYVYLRPYLRAVGERWRLIVGATTLTVFITAILAGLILPKWYRANAVLRPVSMPAVESKLAGVLGGLGGGELLNGGGLGGGLGNLAMSLGGSGSNDAQEYIAILRGFQFSITMTQRHRLSGILLKPPQGLLSMLSFRGSTDPRWKIYRILEKRFDCEYSIKTGNVTLNYIARRRGDAELILNYYIEDLRHLLRAREVSIASSAIDSLKEEAESTPDSLLRSELYELVAKQLQRKKMAQVEADFAFRVLDPPAASDRPYSPNVLLDCSIIGFLTTLGFAIFVSAQHTSYQHTTKEWQVRQSTEAANAERQLRAMTSSSTRP